MQKNFQVYSSVSMPARLKEERTNITSLPTHFDSLTDNPLNHGASYVALKTTAAFQDEVMLNFDLYAEQRGSSYGLLNKDNLLLYPVFCLKGKDTLKIANQSFRLQGKAGMFLNEKLDEGLTIYNVDAQGLQIDIGQNRWLVEGTVYADFFGGIGLNIDDIYSVAFKRKIGKDDSTEIGVSLDYYKEQNQFTPLHSDVLFMAFAHKSFAHSKIYAQVGFRPGHDSLFQASNSINENLACLAGYDYHYSQKGFAFTTNIEARYYGAIFNEWWINYGLRYRKPAATADEMYANTVGDYIYPLRKLNTPFSQWAVYTEYVFSSVFALNFRGNITKDIGKKTFADLAYDLNYIRAKGNFNADNNPPVSSFLYPFFTASANYKIIKQAVASLLITNQAMNLDLSYPTLYLVSHPRLGFRLTASF